MASDDERRPILRPQTPELSHEEKGKDRLQIKARILAGTCPGDWNGGWSTVVLGALLRFAWSICSKQEEELAIKVTLHRHKTTIFVDSFVDSHGLVKAKGKTLLYWDPVLYLAQYGPARDERGYQLIKAFYRRGLSFTNYEGLFHQPLLYLVDCIYRSPVDLKDAFILVQEIGRAYKEVEEEVEEEIRKACPEPRSTLQQVEDWFRARGKSLRSILSRQA